VVEPALCAIGVGDVDQLVRSDREAHPGSRLGPVLELDPFVQPVAEHLLGEHPVRAHVGSEEIDVVEALHGRTSADVALRLIPPGRPEMLWRGVALSLVVQLEDVVVGIGEVVGGAVADIAVDPPEAEPGLLDGSDSPVQRRGAPRAQREVAKSCSGRLGELQAVAEVVTPTAQVDRPALARLLLQSEHVDEEAQALVRLRRQKLRMADPGDVVERVASNVAHGSPAPAPAEPAPPLLGGSAEPTRPTTSCRRPSRS
jgi:hypothetical protein